MNIDIVDNKNQKVGDLKVSEDIFGAKINGHLLHQVVVMQLACKRSGSASTKLRSEVKGTGKKPWKQKGTGRARAGTSTSPIWRGGGVTFGPKPRDYSFKIPKKARKAALKSALSLKAKDNNIVVLDKLELSSPKTKEVAHLLKGLNVSDKVLFLLEKEDKNLQLAARNLPQANVLSLTGLNVYDLLHSSKVILTRTAVSKVEERLQK